MSSAPTPRPPRDFTPPDDPATNFDDDAFASADATGDIVATLPEEQTQLEDTLETGTAIWAIVFAGGIGSRFWPLSTPERPKQLLALVGDRPLIADTVGRLAPLVPPERVLVLTSADIADALRAAIPEVPEANMLVEPRPLGTAAALAWGAQEIVRRVGPRTIFCAMHADLAVGYPDEFRRALRKAAGLASTDPVIVSIGAVPTRAETAFGYIVPGDPIDPDVSLDAGGACKTRRFVEKPGVTLAEELIKDGALWNTGIFLSQAQTVLDDLKEHTHELELGFPALEAGAMPAFSELISSVSIDRGLLERSNRVVALSSDFGWDDVGTWAALRRIRELDDTGNGVWGKAHLVDCESNIVHAEDDGTVVVYGLSGVLVVSLKGLTFVTTLERATELNPLLDQLPRELQGAERMRRQRPTS